MGGLQRSSGYPRNGTFPRVRQVIFRLYQKTERNNRSSVSRRLRMRGVGYETPITILGGPAYNSRHFQRLNLRPLSPCPLTQDSDLKDSGTTGMAQGPVFFE